MHRWSALAGAIGALLAGCAHSPAPLFEAPEEGWVYPEAHPRVRHLRTIHGPSDLGIAPGIVKRMMGWVGGSPARGFTRPYGIAAGEGVLLVADPDQRRVHLMNWESRRYRALDRHGSETFLSPIDVAVGPKGDIYVTDSARGRIYRFGPSGDDRDFTPTCEIVRPTGISVDPVRGRIYVADTGSHTVHVLNEEGKCLFHVGRRGTGPGEFNFPVAVTVTGSGDLLVTDSMNFRIQRFDPEGVWKGSVGSAGDRPGHFARPKGVAVDREGRIFVVDALFGNVQILDPEGNVLLAFGKTGGGAGEFWLPTGIATDRENHIFVGDSYNHRIQVFEVLP